MAAGAINLAEQRAAMMIPFAPYEPDKSVFNPGVSQVLKNVTVNSDHLGPFKTLQSVSNAVPAAPRGSFMATDDTGVLHFFCGTATALYKFNSSTLDWDDVSKAATTYSLGSESFWSFAQFGDWVIATNSADTPDYFDLSGGSLFVALGGSPPASNTVFTTGDFLVFGEGRTLTWSGLNAPEIYTPRKRSSDVQTFPDGGPILGGVGFPKGALIFQQSSIREMIPALTSPLIFEFDESNEDRSVLSQKSMVATGDRVFYLTREGLYEYGNPTQPVGFQKIDREIADDIDPNFEWMVEGTADPINQVVYWRYRSSSAATDGITDKMVSYNYSLGQWATIDVQLTGLMPAATTGSTLEQLDAFGTLDSLAFSLDSNAWAGGAPVIGGFGTDFKLGVFGGENLEACARTGAVRLNERGRAYVRGFKPVTDASGVTGRVGKRSTHADVTTWNPVANRITATGTIPARAEAMLHQFELIIPAGETWTALHGVEPDAIGTGQR